MAGAKMGRLCAQMGVTLTQALASSLGLGFLPVHGGEGGVRPTLQGPGHVGDKLSKPRSSEHVLVRLLFKGLAAGGAPGGGRGWEL